MKKQSTGKRRQKIHAIILILTFFILLGNLSAKDRKKGADIIVQKKDGKTIKGELLAVKNDAIILMDSLNLSGIKMKSKEIRKITIAKKSGFFKGLGLGLVIGGGSGALLGLASGDDKSGWFSMTAGEKAAVGGLGFGILGALAGGIVGTIKGIDESVVLEGRTAEEMVRVLRKLNTKSRFPQAMPQIYQEIKPDPIHKSKEEKLKENENIPGSFDAEKINDSKKSSGQKFSRIHISFRPGYFSSQGATDTVHFFEKIGMGDTKPGGNLAFFGISFGSYGPTEFPQVNKKPVIFFAETRIDYSLTRNLALGIGYAPLGKHSVSGYKKILVYGEGRTYYSNLYLKENYSGEMFYLSGSWMPIPDAFLRKVGLKLGVSAGISSIKLNYQTSKWGYSESGGEYIEFSKKGLVLAGFAELDYYFNKRLSLGVSTEYRYIPVRIMGTKITGYYDDLGDNMELINSSMLIDIPEHNMNLGGFRFGISIGLHL
jgi:hypothetical protein